MHGFMKAPILCGRKYYRPYWKILLCVSCSIFSNTVTYMLCLYTVEPLNNGHIGMDHFIHYGEVVPFQR